MTGSFDEDFENATADVEQAPARPASSRRTFVAGTLGAGAGVAATLGIQYAAGASERDSPTPAPPLQEARVPFYGQRQAGVDTPAPSYALFIALDLNGGTDADGVQRLLRVLTSDAASLTQGTAPVVDQEPELATVPAHLTVTFGFGERIFDIVNPAQKPTWLQPLPAFEKIDQLQDQWNDGDLLLQLCSSDR